MKKKKIIITYKYPYEPPTEVFLHNELNWIISKGDEVLIIPTAGNIFWKNRYEQTQSFLLYPLAKVKLKNKHVCFLLKIFMLTFKYYYNDVKISKFKIPCISNSAKYCLWVAIKFSKCLDQIITYASDCDELLIYSYWFSSNALLGCTIKLWLKMQFPKLHVRLLSRAHGDGDLYYDRKLEIRPGYNLLQKCMNEIYPISAVGKELLDNEFSNILIKTERLGVNGPKHSILGNDTEYNLIVSCSTVNENKRVFLIANALSKVIGKNIKWVHFGDGPGFDKLKMMVQNFDDKNLEVNLLGNTLNKDVLEYYAKHKPDLFINLSIVEGLPVSIMEAMSYSIPVLATNTGATKEIVSEEVNGYLVKIDSDADFIASVILRYLNLSPERKNQFRKDAYFTWNSLYKAEKNYKEFAKILTHDPWKDSLYEE